MFVLPFLLLNLCYRLGEIPAIYSKSSAPPVYDGRGNKLLMSFVIFHHGESSPAKPLVYPTFDFSFRLWPNGTDHLTGQGKRQMEILGKSIRRYYEPISFMEPEPVINLSELTLDLLLPDKTGQSGKVDDISNSLLKKRDLPAEEDKYHFRTLKINNYIEGAHHFAKGFFQSPNLPYPTGPPPPPNFYLDSLNYTYNDTFATIAPQTVLPAHDYLLYGGLACPKFNDRVRQIMTQSAEAKYINEEFRTLFQTLGIGSGIRDMSMMYVPVLVDALLILRGTRDKYLKALESGEPGIDETLKSNLTNFLPPWLGESDFTNLVKIYQNLWYQTVYKEGSQIKLGVGQLLNRLIDLMLGGIGKVKTLIPGDGNEFISIENPHPDLHFFVVPRHTLLAFRKALTQDYKKKPPKNEPKVRDIKRKVDKVLNGKVPDLSYGETIMIELVQTDEVNGTDRDAGKRYLVKFYEKRSADTQDIIKPLKAGKCGKACPLKSFYSQIKDILPAHIEKECTH